MRITGMHTVLLIAVCGAGAAHADCKFTADRDGAADIAGVTKVVLRAGPGDLNIVGSADSKRIVAKGHACASSQALLDNLLLEVRREGDVVYIDAGLGNTDKIITVGNTYAHLNVGIALPAGLRIEARDSSGDTKVSGVEAIALHDGSGDIEIEDVGSVTVEDGSGDIEIDRTRGDAVVTLDGSGDIEIEDVGGSVEIGSDGSGEIRVERVIGSVVVGSDGSGNIEVANVGGDFTVGTDGSGGIDYREVAGKISVP